MKLRVSDIKSIKILAILLGFTVLLADCSDDDKQMEEPVAEGDEAVNEDDEVEEYSQEDADSYEADDSGADGYEDVAYEDDGNAADAAEEVLEAFQGTEESYDQTEAAEDTYEDSVDGVTPGNDISYSDSEGNPVYDESAGATSAVADAAMDEAADPVAEPMAAAPVSAPVAATMPNNGQRVYYVTGSVKAHQSADPSSPTIGSFERGDHVLVAMEGSWARLSNGGYVMASSLTTKPVGRTLTAGSWRNP